MAQAETKISDIPKLLDAPYAGGKEQGKCTLILTEGDSAKSLVLAGLDVLEKEYYGVFPLQGKLSNVSKFTIESAKSNEKLKQIVAILGLKYDKEYTNTTSLRYGKLMIMADQDPDGSHIKGLIILFIYKFWPSLLKIKFVEQFITPILIASNAHEKIPFYSKYDFEKWKAQTSNWDEYDSKYYKGLGTFNRLEIKEYFCQIKKHRYTFTYDETKDKETMDHAFCKNPQNTETRRKWQIEHLNTDRLKETCMYKSDEDFISIKDFVMKELVLFYIEDNKRSIPSMVDGLKPSQRKVIFTCFKRNDTKEIKVPQLASSVAEHTNYHNGDDSLHKAIIALARSYVGSNNINLLQPNGQFGTRLDGGEDGAAPRYINTMLNPLARLIFNELDSSALTPSENMQKMEPQYYVPIIPMVLVNGAVGIGTGSKTQIPPFNPIDIVKNLIQLLDGKEVKQMIPWFKGFKGQVELLAENPTTYATYGIINMLENKPVEESSPEEPSSERTPPMEQSAEIIELPIGIWTNDYKKTLLKLRKTSIITSFKEFNTDTTVRFVVTATEKQFQKFQSEENIHDVFELKSRRTLSSMVLFDQSEALKKYESVKEILKDFFEVRINCYKRRAEHFVSFSKPTLTVEERNLKEEYETNSVEEIYRMELLNFLKEYEEMNKKETEIEEELMKKINQSKTLEQSGTPSGSKVREDEYSPSPNSTPIKPNVTAMKGKVAGERAPKGPVGRPRKIFTTTSPGDVNTLKTEHDPVQTPLDLLPTKTLDETQLSSSDGKVSDALLKEFSKLDIKDNQPDSN